LQDCKKVGDATLQVDVFDEENFPIWRSQLGICPRFFFIDGTIRENLIWDAEHIPDENEIFEILLQVNALHLVRDQQLDSILL
jgi:ABC-type multidrug transport system fused ATPase/permease subunit